MGTLSGRAEIHLGRGGARIFRGQGSTTKAKRRAKRPARTGERTGETGGITHHRGNGVSAEREVGLARRPCSRCFCESPHDGAPAERLSRRFGTCLWPSRLPTQRREGTLLLAQSFPGRASERRESFSRREKQEVEGHPASTDSASGTRARRRGIARDSHARGRGRRKRGASGTGNDERPRTSSLVKPPSTPSHACPAWRLDRDGEGRAMRARNGAVRERQDGRSGRGEGAGVSPDKREACDANENVRSASPVLLHDRSREAERGRGSGDGGKATAGTGPGGVDDRGGGRSRCDLPRSPGPEVTEAAEHIFHVSRRLSDALPSPPLVSSMIRERQRRKTTLLEERREGAFSTRGFDRKLVRERRSKASEGFLDLCGPSERNSRRARYMLRRCAEAFFPLVFTAPPAPSREISLCCRRANS